MRILVVDDEERFGRFLERTIAKLGHAPMMAVHPVDALEMFHEHEFDAVVTDIDMPVMNGVELARTIRLERPDIPIVFCTGSGPKDRCVKDATRFGQVLPKLRRVSDVRQLLRSLRADADAALALTGPLARRRD